MLTNVRDLVANALETFEIRQSTLLFSLFLSIVRVASNRDSSPFGHHLAVKHSSQRRFLLANDWNIALNGDFGLIVAHNWLSFVANFHWTSHLAQIIVVLHWFEVDRAANTAYIVSVYWHGRSPTYRNLGKINGSCVLRFLDSFYLTVFLVWCIRGLTRTLVISCVKNSLAVNVCLRLLRSAFFYDRVLWS